MRRWALVLALLSLAGCAHEHAWTPDEIIRLIETHNGSGCIQLIAAYPAVGNVRLAGTFGQELSEELKRYCFPPY